MHAYIVSGGLENSVMEEAKKFAEKIGKKVYEFSALKIDDIRNLNKFTKYSFDEPTAIILKDLEKATEEAVNALLKNLEEPKTNISFVICATSYEKLLPTIVSRCQIVKVKKEFSKAEDLHNQTLKFIEKNSFSELMMYTDTIKKREDAVDLMREVVISLHQSLLKGDKNLTNASHALYLAEETYKNLRANGNTSLQLTNFVVKYCKIAKI